MAAPDEEPLRAVSGSVLVAAVVGSVAALPAVPLLAGDRLTQSALLQLVAWPPLAFVGALVLDRRPRSRAGWAFVGLAPLGWLLVGWGLVNHSGQLTWERLGESVSALGPWPAVVTLVVLGTIFGRAPDRLARRRRFWMFLLVASGSVTVIAFWRLLPHQVAVLETAVLWLAAVVGGFLLLVDELRPVDEPLLDVAVVVGVVAAAAAAGLVVRFGGLLAGLRSADLSGVFAAVTAAALAVPGALWVRHSVLARRYGSGILPPADVAAITADLDSEGDPRELLGKAATMVAAASGSKHTQIVLGDVSPEGPELWSVHPLVVGERRVGSLLVEAQHLEGPEPRQQRVVAQLLPTVALVAQAVTLAVEAEHARRDVARERDAERARMLADLHDDLGPVLSGMSMRVQAARRGRSEALLDDLATDLAACRADLRRIVSGLTPSALHEGDLAAALERLMLSFRQTPGGPSVVLVGEVPSEVSTVAAIAVYRTVAEGVTNAARHARASAITVRVEACDDRLRAEVADDGPGGPIAPGVGLTSLRHRAEELGGTLAVGAGQFGGTRLIIDLPRSAA